jgi:hypothetical protein
MAEVSRNAPCPCGSGKKYKHCHLGQELATTKRSNLVKWLVGLALAAAAGAFAGFAKGTIAGVAVGGGGALVVAIAIVLMSPPPPGQGGDPGAINFGK